MYVYILQSQTPPKYYTGITTNLKKRLQQHNAGLSKYTSSYRQWIIKNYFWFNDPAKAIAFEKYLKSGSGRAFARTRF